MPTTARTRLPSQVIDFLEEFCLTGDGKTAAINVGVHPRRAESFVRETMDHPDAREAFDQIMRTRFSHAAPMAMNLLLEVVQDKTHRYSGAVQVEAAKALLDRSGYSTKALAAPAGKKDLHEMSRDELLQIVNQGETELASRAKEVESVPIGHAIATQVIDIEE